MLKTDSILTPAETRIAARYCDGLVGKEIADVENISYHTVVRHTQNIYEKTGIRRCTNALVSWFLSTNCNIDIKDLERNITGFFLLLIISVQTVAFTGDTFVRSGRRARTETRARRTRRNEESTLYLE